MWLMNCKHFTTVTFIVLSITTYIYYSHLLSQSRYSEEKAKLQDSLKQVSSKVMTLRQRYSRIVCRVKKIPGLSDLIDAEDKLLGDYLGPTEEYENIRRRIYSNTKELWYYLHYQLGRASIESLKPDQIKTILEEVANRKRSLLSDLEKLPALDGYEAWRRHEAASVSDLVQRRLHYLQHPSDCRAARKLVCDQPVFGFGCQVHHLVSCLIHAYASERTLIQIHSRKWVFARKKTGWNDVFEPFSNNCTGFYNETFVQFSVSSDDKVFWLPFNREVYYDPTHLPKDLAQRIIRFNGDPISWWIGQMVKYIFKPLKKTQRKIHRRIHRMVFKSPMVGVHVRRTDKIIEAEYYDIDEYMSHVEDFYAQLELTQAVDQRRVYLATDDTEVLEKAIKKYPKYTFYGDYTRARMAYETRYTDSALSGLLVDLHMLTLCDYVVLTLSSNIGRMVYELMQTNRDASSRLYTLDSFYYLVRAGQHLRIAVIHHQRLQNFTFNIGDLINVRRNYWNGTAYGINMKSNVSGRFPWYKTAEYFVSYPFPEYKRVPVYTQSTKLIPTTTPN